MVSQSSSPGGRHDNDCIDFRKIAIYPTEDELTSKDRSYYNTARMLVQVPVEIRVAHHLDNQFRLLREDFLAELREDIDTSSGKKKASSRRQRTRLQDLRLAGLYCGGDRSRQPCSLAISVGTGLGHISNASNRSIYLSDGRS